MNCNVSICKAECCGPIPFNISIFNRFKYLIEKKYELEMLSDSVIIALTDDLSCIFLNENYKCKIYENRPFLCKMFGDPSQKNDLLKCHHLGQIDKNKIDSIIKQQENELKELLNDK